jgi:hypothetical protein
MSEIYRLIRLPLAAFILLLSFVVVGCGGSGYSEAKTAMPQSESGAAADGDYAGEAAADEVAAYDDDMYSRNAVAQASPPPTAPGANPPAPPKVATDATGGGEVDTSEGPITKSRKPLLIYTATLTMAVFEAKQAIDKVEKYAMEHGGYLVRRGDQSITVRVPSAKFQGSLEAIGKVGDELHRDVSVRDVTEEFSDLEIRLRNAQVVRERLEQLLQTASTVQVALAVERELERVAGAIERM